MNKIVLGLFIVGFWLFLPIPFMIMDIGEYQAIDLEEAEETEDIGFLDFLGTMADLFGVYWRLFFFTIPDVNQYLNYFILFIKVSTILFTLIMLRGN